MQFCLEYVALSVHMGSVGMAAAHLTVILPLIVHYCGEAQQPPLAKASNAVLSAVT